MRLQLEVRGTNPLALFKLLYTNNTNPVPDATPNLCSIHTRAHAHTRLSVANVRVTDHRNIKWSPKNQGHSFLFFHGKLLLLNMNKHVSGRINISGSIYCFLN